MGPGISRWEEFTAEVVVDFITTPHALALGFRTHDKFNGRQRSRLRKFNVHLDQYSQSIARMRASC